MTLSTIARTLPSLWHNRQRRRHLLRGMGLMASIGVGMAGYSILHEPLRVQLDHLTIRLPNATGHLPSHGLRVLHLSDTHFKGEQWREQRKIASIIKTCANLDYDLLIHTGDFLHEDGGLQNVLALLDALPSPRLGGFAVFGNHDYSVYSHNEMLPRAWAKFNELQAEQQTHHGAPTWLRNVRAAIDFADYFANSPLDLKRTGRNDTDALEAALLARNIQPLHNRHTHLQCPASGVDLYLAGIDDLTEGSPDLISALRGIPMDAPTVLLSHNPDILSESGIEQSDLILAGHTHGGQIVLPILGAAHTQTKNLRRHEVSGYLRRGNTQIYITRGIGEGIPLRFRATPQVTLLTLLPE